MLRTYRERNRVLKSLGFASYKKYISSPLWISIKSKVRKLRGEFCQICGGKGKHVHHLNYRKDVLVGDNLDPLVVLCGRCHYKVEFDGGGSKREVWEAQGAYTRLLKSTPKKNLR